MVAVLILGTSTSDVATAQDYSYYRYKENKERYAQTLGQILDDARADLGIEIEVSANAEPFLTETVPVAPWKLFGDAELRLAYFLAPLDLTFEKTGENSYRVFEPWYQNRPEEEGAAHLKRLVRRFPDKESWEKRRADVRAAILETFGLNPLPAKTPLNPKTTEVAEYDGYTTQDVALEIVPKIWVCGTLYRPTAVRSRSSRRRTDTANWAVLTKTTSTAPRRSREWARSFFRTECSLGARKTRRLESTASRPDFRRDANPCDDSSCRLFNVA